MPWFGKWLLPPLALLLVAWAGGVFLYFAGPERISPPSLQLVGGYTFGLSIVPFALGLICYLLMFRVRRLLRLAIAMGVVAAVILFLQLGQPT